jgi:hypothetical protein
VGGGLPSHAVDAAAFDDEVLLLPRLSPTRPAACCARPNWSSSACNSNRRHSCASWA